MKSHIIGVYFFHKHLTFPSDSRTGSEYASADLGGVQVVVDESVDEGGDLALDDEVARRLEVGDDLAQAGAELETLFINSC